MNAYRNIAQRAVNAEESFANALIAIAGISRSEASRVIAAYRKAKIIKTDFVGGRMTVTHGAFMDAEVIRRAANA